ncbi:11186_t:CDS:2, partial [Gigaspora rosea]
QEEKKEIREVLEKEFLDEKVNKEVMKLEKEPVEKEGKEQSRWMQIDTENELKKEDKTEEIGNSETYTLWDLPPNFNNCRIKTLMRRYSKVSNIIWISSSFKKRAIVNMAIKDVKSKQILDETWSLPTGRKLIRVFQGDSKEEVLMNRRKFRLIIEGIPKDTVEVLLFRQLKQVKAKSVFIPLNNNRNSRSLAFVYFNKEEDMIKAFNTKINYGNTLLFWKDMAGGNRAERQNILTEKRNRDNPYLEDKKWKRTSWKKNKVLFKNNQKTTLRFNKKDVVHNKENETTEHQEKISKEKEGCPNAPESCESCTKEKVGSRGLAASTKKPTTEQSAKRSGEFRRGLKGKKVRENELGNQEEDKENRKGNVKKWSKNDNLRGKLGVEKEEKVSLIEQIK